jgi:hypothetical protein
MSKPYRQIYIENIDTIRAKVLELMPSSMLNADTSFVYNSELHEQLMTIPDLITAVEQFGGMSQVNRIAFLIVKPYEKCGTHCDYSTLNYSFNIPILNFVDTYIRMYTHDPEMTLCSYTNVLGKTIQFWSVDENRCQLINEIETIYPHIIDTRFPHQVINNRPTVRINMLLRLKPLELDCMK